MSRENETRIRDLIERLGRLIAANEWGDDINPTQWAALSYLAKANRFSRAPSQVADFMSTTRGTVSQTLKALARKGLIDEGRSAKDKRSISYTLTEKGWGFIQNRQNAQDTIIFDDANASQLEGQLEALLRAVLKSRDLRPFGLCKTCRHNQVTDNGSYCRLLGEVLAVDEVQQICHEHAN